MFLVNGMLSYVLYIKDHWTSCHMARILSKSTVWEHFPNKLAKWKLYKQDKSSFVFLPSDEIFGHNGKRNQMSILESTASFAPLGSTACDNFSEKMKAQIQALQRDRTLSMRCSSRSFHSRLTRWSMIGLIDLSGCILIEPSPSALEWPSPSGDHLSKWQGKHRERHWDEH